MFMPLKIVNYCWLVAEKTNMKLFHILFFAIISRTHVFHLNIRFYRLQVLSPLASVYQKFFNSTISSPINLYIVISWTLFVFLHLHMQTEPDFPSISHPYQSPYPPTKFATNDLRTWRFRPRTVPWPETAEINAKWWVMHLIQVYHGNPQPSFLRVITHILGV